MARPQARASLVPDAPFLDPGRLACPGELECRWDEISEEARAVLRPRGAIRVPAFYRDPLRSSRAASRPPSVAPAPWSSA
jgi:hypothetical protein